MHMNGWADRHDKVTRHFSKFCTHLNIMPLNMFDTALVSHNSQ